MPIVFPVVVALIPLLVAFVVLALHQSLDMWLRPIVSGIANPKGGIVSRVTGAVPRLLFGGLRWIYTHVRAVLSAYVDTHAPMMTKWLGGQAARVDAQAREFGNLAVATADSLGFLRHHTLPRVAKSAAAPALERAKVADRTARRSISLGRRETTERRRSIDRLRKVLGPLALTVLGIDVLVKGRHARVHHREHAHDIPQIRDRDIPRLKTRERAHESELARTKARLKRLERALGLGVIAGLVYRVLSRVAPWLFCRNVKKLGNLACGLNPNTMSALEALLLGTLAIQNLETLARFTVAIEEDVAKEVKSLLNA